MTIENKRKTGTIFTIVVGIFLFTYVNLVVKPTPPYTKTGKVIDKTKYFDTQNGKIVKYQYRVELQYGNDEFNTLEPVKRSQYEAAVIGNDMTISVDAYSNLPKYEFIIICATLVGLVLVWLGWFIEKTK